MQLELTKISNFYSSVLLRSIRLIVIFFILSGLFFGIANGYTPKFSIFAFIWFVIIEIFMHYKVGKVRPTVVVTQSTTDLTQSCTMSVLKSFINSSDGYDFVISLSRNQQSSFYFERIPITKENIEKVEITKDDLLKNAGEIVKKVQGIYITPADILTSYLLLTEERTKLLFKNELKEKDLYQILSWTRQIYYQDENPHIETVSTGGFGDALLTGWTPETQDYTEDVTTSAFYNRPQITGREEEFTRMIETLGKNDNNNVLLAGEVGSGRENLVHLLAVRSQQGLLPVGLNNKKIIQLHVGRLIAGATDKGILETRIEAIIQEVMHAGNIILYIPELQNILGSSSYGLDLSGVLLPYLKNGSLPIIATMTKGNFKSFFEKNPLKEAFLSIQLEEPTPETALLMIFHKTDSVEDKFRVILTYNAVKESVALANRYFPDRTLPGSALSLLEDVSDTVSKAGGTSFANSGKKLITKDLIIQKVQQTTHLAVAEPSATEKQLLLNLEAKLHERVIGQRVAVQVIAESLRRLRSGLASQKKPISFLFLGPTGVGKTETAKALGDIYFGGEEKILRLDMSEYADTDGVKRLLGAPPGEGDERGELTDRIHDHPASLVLLDEFEKANPKIRDLFLQVLEDGRLTDNKGRTVSFLNAIIVATSNAGSEFIRQEIQKTTPDSQKGDSTEKEFKARLLNTLQEKNIFTPELLNRFDDIVIFRPLGQDVVKEIVKLILKKITRTLEEQDITVKFDDSVIEKIAKDGQDIQFGARPLLRYVYDNIEDKIAQEKLKDNIVRGDHIALFVGQDGQIQIKKEQVA